MGKLKILTSVLCLLCIVVSVCYCENKYSAEANQRQNYKPMTGSVLDDSVQVEFRSLNKPFRMAKLNLLWTKAQLRLTEPKLKSLYSDLKIHDKEELAHKRQKSEGGDKDGLKEDIIRRKLIGIMSSYDLLEHFEDVHNKDKHKEHEAFNGSVEDHINKSMFKDKKLNKLWVKAEMSGFSIVELQALKEEFQHHQDKIDQYYSLLTDMEAGKTDNIDNAMDNEEMDAYNTITADEDRAENSIHKDYLHKANLIREKHRELRDGYDGLSRRAAKGPLSKDFIEPKVQDLWRTAMQGNFTQQELDSLRVELMHYESRLLKLRHLQAERASHSDKLGAKMAEIGDKNIDLMEDTIKKHMRKVEKLHSTIENRILERHTEL